MASHGPKITSLEPEMVAFGGPFVFLEGPLVATEEHKLASEKLKVASRRLKWPLVAPRMTSGPKIAFGGPMHYLWSAQSGGREGKNFGSFEGNR